MVAIPYIVWDAIVTNSHWMFNDNYVMGIYLFNLPIEELMFFFTVPFACLYTWHMILQRTNDIRIEKLKIIRQIIYFLPIPGLYLFFSGLEYTGLVFIFMTIAVLVDRWLETDLLLRKQFYIYLLWIIGFTLVFNGFLTWRPVVLYGESFQVGFRVITIPIEDFAYGISLLFLNTSLFEKLKSAPINVLKAT
jgi:lycopene cyclase domain-containing protein